MQMSLFFEVKMSCYEWGGRGNFLGLTFKVAEVIRTELDDNTV
jgi:hypothetical protein